MGGGGVRGLKIRLRIGRYMTDPLKKFLANLHQASLASRRETDHERAGRLLAADMDRLNSAGLGDRPHGCTAHRAGKEKLERLAPFAEREQHDQEIVFLRTVREQLRVLAAETDQRLAMLDADRGTPAHNARMRLISGAEQRAASRAVA